MATNTKDMWQKLSQRMTNDERAAFNEWRSDVLSGCVHVCDSARKSKACDIVQGNAVILYKLLLDMPHMQEDDYADEVRDTPSHRGYWDRCKGRESRIVNEIFGADRDEYLDGWRQASDELATEYLEAKKKESEAAA